jgi:hypothetical protein
MAIVVVHGLVLCMASISSGRIAMSPYLQLMQPLNGTSILAGAPFPLKVELLENDALFAAQQVITPPKHPLDVATNRWCTLG